jgi:hypothetical protein
VTSLGRTGFARSIFEQFQRIAQACEEEGSYKIDLAFYRYVSQQKIPVKMRTDMNMHLGIKGMYNTNNTTSRGLTKRHTTLNNKKENKFFRIVPWIKIRCRREENFSPEDIYRQLCHEIGENDANAYYECIFNTCDLQ